MRMTRSWLFRERAIRGPSAIELDVLERQVAREERGLRTAVDESRQIEQTLQRARHKTAAALSDDNSPGVIDDREADDIARELLDGSVLAHRHTQTLEALT
jgi:hypothetical protein